MIIRIMGGLGNQLFQYAQAKALYSLGVENIKFDVDCTNQKTPRNYDLPKLNTISFSIAKHDDVLLYEKIRSLCYLHNGFRFLAKLFGYGFEKKEFTIQNNIKYKYIDGYWQNEAYFKNLRTELIVELKYDWNLNEKQKKLCSMIESCNSVAVHVRRGDYLSIDNSKYFNTLKKETYYDIAFDMVKELEDSVKFFFFSDDIEWCKNEFSINDHYVFVDNSYTSNALEDFEIMKKCKHFIISNSTFSWWASWLSNYEDKICIAPSCWYINQEINRRCVEGLLQNYILV